MTDRTNPFDADDLARAYAADGPAVHPAIVELVRDDLAGAPPGAAVDVGCGAGASLAALAAVRPQAVGIDPSPAMVRRVAADLPVLVAGAEHLPFRDRSVAVLAAAGSLDFADVDRFAAEAGRVLVVGGVVVVYDFGLGVPPATGDWASRFATRFPTAAAAGPSVPERLADQTALSAGPVRPFTVELELAHDAYLAYLLSETRVVAAVDAGGDADEVRRWCAAELRTGGVSDPAPIWFTGYLVVLRGRGMGDDRTDCPGPPDPARSRPASIPPMQDA